MKLVSLLLLVLGLANVACAQNNFPSYSDFADKPYTVTYDKRALKLNDSPSIFLSGSIHYPRFSPGMWLPMLQQAKSDGLNLVEIYVFWNGHEPVEGQFNWGDRYNLTGFLDAVSEAGLFANLRIGPYVCAEWSLGGIPSWLQFNRPGIRFRSFESQWRQAMQEWMGRVIAKTRDYFADRGGPIILAQVENELNGGDPRYVQWSGDMANAFNVNVPWIMCNGQSASNTINTCNGNDCTGFLQTHGQSGRILVDQPAIWTENEMWFQSWGQSSTPLDVGNNRTSEDVAFTVMRWFARGGSVMNDYMYFGGNNYGTTAGGGVTTMYADGAHHHADGLPNEPRYTHINQMHEQLAALAETLATNPAALDFAISLSWRSGPSQPWSSGTQQLAFTYGKNLIFIESSASIFVQTQYNNIVYDMPPNSIIVVQNGAVSYNSSNVKAVVSHRSYTPALADNLTWHAWSEPVFSIKPSMDQSVDAAMPIFLAQRPLEQLNLTRDLTDFMWYSTIIDTSTTNVQVPFSIDAGTAEAFQLFIDGQSVANTWDYSHSWVTSSVKLTGSIAQLSEGPHVLSLLSTSLGLQNGMDPDEDPIENHQQGVNIGGNITINGQDFTHQTWAHRPYLVGEYLQIYDPAYSGSVSWTSADDQFDNQPVTWFTTQFAPLISPNDGQQYTILLDINGLGRGHAFINGNDIGRYWSVLSDSSKQPTQRYYQIPIDWLKWENGDMNTLTIIEEIGVTNLDTVTIVTSQIVYGSWGDESTPVKEFVKVASE